MIPRFNYRIFDCEVSSAIEMPVLIPGRATACDVEIEKGAICEQPGDAETLHFRNWRASPGRMLLEIPAVGRFLMTGGNRIRVEPAPGANDADLVPHLQGSAFAAILQQRHLLPIHAASIETDRGAVLFSGSSGAGKSTLLNEFLARGFRLIADDVTAVRLDRGKPLAMPAFPATRLWQDSVEALGHDVAHLTRVRSDLDKYYLPVAGFRPDPQPIHAVVLLGMAPGDTVRLVELPLSERIGKLVQFSYRKHFLAGHRLRDMQFAAVSAIAAHTRVVRLERPAGRSTRRELADAVAEAFAIGPRRPLA